MSSARYIVPARRHRVEEEIQKSRFITTVGPAGDVEEAKAFIADVSAEFPDATHNCWAFLVGPPGSTGRVGMSDDGEPHGTAGKPMLNVLVHGGVGDLAAVVTRYYGGKKLGKGGLVRAYGNGVKIALESLPTKERVTTVQLGIRLGYSLVDPFQRLLPAFEAAVVEESYAEEVAFVVELPEDEVDGFRAELTTICAGRVVIDTRD